MNLFDKDRIRKAYEKMYSDKIPTKIHIKGDIVKKDGNSDRKIGDIDIIKVSNSNRGINKAIDLDDGETANIEKEYDDTLNACLNDDSEDDNCCCDDEYFDIDDYPIPTDDILYNSNRIKDYRDFISKCLIPVTSNLNAEDDSERNAKIVSDALRGLGLCVTCRKRDDDFYNDGKHCDSYGDEDSNSYMMDIQFRNSLGERIKMLGQLIKSAIGLDSADGGHKIEFMLL